MAEFIKSFIILIAAILISIVQFPLGFVYAIGHAVFMTIRMKRKWHYTFSKIWQMIDGYLASIGYGMYYVAEALDIGWNVNGEILEDLVTHEENTYFTEKNMTVSATMGHLKINKKLNRFGIFCTQILDFVFQQKDHCGGAWKYRQANRKLKQEIFEKWS